MSLGIQGNILQAIQFLNADVTCSVRINEYLTDFYPVTQGLKQGCGLSPTLFSIYVNDQGPELQCLLKVKEDLSKVFRFQHAISNAK